jgi:hypothetical protein
VPLQQLERDAQAVVLAPSFCLMRSRASVRFARVYSASVYSHVSGADVAQHAFRRTGSGAGSGAGGDDAMEAVSIMQQRLAVLEREIHDGPSRVA